MHNTEISSTHPKTNYKLAMKASIMWLIQDFSDKIQLFTVETIFVENKHLNLKLSIYIKYYSIGTHHQVLIVFQNSQK